MAKEDLKLVNQRIDQIITTTNLVADSFSLPNGSTVNTTITTTNPGGAKILGLVDFTYYVGSISDANAIPYGSGISMADYDYIPPYNDWGKTNNTNVKTIAQLKNNSGSSKTILVRAYVRTITNSPTPGGSVS